MFDHLNKEDGMDLKRRIGDFVSNRVVNDKMRNHLATVEELNAMDRLQLARNWYERETKSPWLKRRFEAIIGWYYIDAEHFFDEVARYIDDRIPRAFEKHNSSDRLPCDVHPGGVCIKPDADGNLPSGLIYHYSSNHPGSVDVAPCATEKQIKYLVDLSAKANHRFIPEGISKDEARACIDYFLNMDLKVEPECFSKYFRRSI